MKKTTTKIMTLALALVMILALIPFTATGASGAVTLSIPKTQYAEGERIWVTVTGITQEMINNSNWIAVYTVGGDTTMYHDWKYVKTVGTEIIPLDLPKTLGTYEIRFVPQFAAAYGHSAVSSTFSTVANPPVTDDIGDYLWAGEWNTSWGKMTIRQNGSSIVGEYEQEKGKFEGTVHGNTIVGKWSDEPTYNPPDDAGFIRMWMSEGGNMMDIGFSYGFDHPSYWIPRTGAARLTALEAVPNAPSRQPTPAPSTTGTPPTTTTTNQPSTSNLSANPTASTVYVNGAATAFEAYNIGGNNYFKLRDLAYALNGTAKQFEVGYDNATKAITLTTGQAYTPDGGEMASGDGTAKTATPTASRIYLDGVELDLTVYLIGGNNFFKLRDLMEAIDVFVGYDNATKAITLDTSKRYVPEGSTATPTPTSTPTPTPGTVDDSVSMNALVGNWFPDGRGLISIWSFGADSRFAYYERATTSYNPDPSHFILASKYELFVKGNYRVSGDTIECYDVFCDAYFDFGSSVKYFGDADFRDIADKLLGTPLQDSEKMDSFFVKYEFIDTMCMRLVIDTRNIKYDWDFDYLGNSHNVTIPTHSLPGVAWPRSLLPSGTPEYSGGRIRNVYDEREERSGELIIYIDKTTGQAFENYINSLLNAGWENYWGHVSMENIVYGNSMGNFKKDDLTLWFGRHRSYYYLRFW